MTTHERKQRPQITPAEYRARKEAQKAKAKAAPNYYMMGKYEALRFDYSVIGEEYREPLQRAALDVRQRLRRTVEDMIEIGKQLTWARGVLAHGTFEDWVQTEFGMSDKSGVEYRQIATRFDGKREIISLLTPTTARLLAPPRVPAEVIAAVVEAGEARGAPLRVREVRALLPARAPRAPAPKQLPGPTAPAYGFAVGHDLRPDGGVIEAEYRILAPAQLPAPTEPGKVAVMLPPELAAKLRDGLFQRIFRLYFTGEESDQLLLALTQALKGAGL